MKLLYIIIILVNILNTITGIDILAKLKNREEFQGELEKRKGKGGEKRKKEKNDKTHVKIPL